VIGMVQGGLKLKAVVASPKPVEVRVCVSRLSTRSRGSRAGRLVIESRRELKGKPLAPETATKTDVIILSLGPILLFSSLVFRTVATSGSYQLGTTRPVGPSSFYRQ